MKSKLVLTCAATMLWAVPSSIAWGPDGHEITALIAAQHLSPAARTMVFNLLKNDSDAGDLLIGKHADDVTALGAAMARASTWPDRVKQQSVGKGTSGWHFIDLAKNEDASTIPGRCGSAGNCVTSKIAEFKMDIPAGKTFSTQFNTYQPSDELKFLIHFMGDVHQPLHAATNADAGGNCIPTKGFSAPELHAEWDSGLLSRITGTGQAKKPNATVALGIDGEFTTQFSDIVKKLGETDMAMESHDIAFDAAYGKILSMLPDPEPRPFKDVNPRTCEGAEDLKALKPIDVTVIYDNKTLAIVKERLAMGGYRLAAILNGMAK